MIATEIQAGSIKLKKYTAEGSLPGGDIYKRNKRIVTAWRRKDSNQMRIVHWHISDR